VAELVHLQVGGTSVVLNVSTGVPTVVHWGAALGDGAVLDTLTSVLDRPPVHGSLDVVAPGSLVPEHGSGWQGHPGLLGRRPDGTAWAPRFSPATWRRQGEGVVAEAVDDVAGLRLTTEIELDVAVLRVRVMLTNTGTEAYGLDELSVTLPLPAHAEELLTFEGRWCREMHPQRRAFGVTSMVAENRRGHTSHEHAPLAFAGTPAFGEWHGEVWGVHLAWSGNHQVRFEGLADGRRVVQLGELLHPGEVELAPGASYTTPWVLAVHGTGLTPASWGFHRYLRSLPRHPQRPRPVLLNTWEAVYFDHDLDRLKALADAAAAVGIERFVLDDGWFGGRRHDRAGLGDWWVSPEAHPHGLGPLIDHVRSRGMEFGIWVEPEMVNEDSDLYRAHPEWVLATPGYPPVYGRQQLVLDLGRPEAYEHVLGLLDALLRDHDIAYLKWDMNRDHVQGSGAESRAGTHAQTLAVYRLLDELHARHPAVEIESCSSGGARIDAGILERTDRVWTSDCNDALERQVIQRHTALLVPPELMGAHIGPSPAHTTGRRHSFPFRALTAFFGHLGVEWNLLDLPDAERSRLAEIVALHQRFRPLLHSGDTVRFDLPGGEAHAYGAYAPDRSEALVAFVQLRTGPSLAPAPLRLPGLTPDRRYRVEHLPLPGEVMGPGKQMPAWWFEGAVLSGAQLAAHGVQLPVLLPESGVLLHLTSA
jgi:alpha-galactosidase